MGNEWMLLSFTCCSVLAAGCISAAALGEVRGAAWRLTNGFALGALLAVAAGCAAAVANLGQPLLVLGALGNPGSGIFWELISSASLLAGAVGYLLAGWRGAGDGMIRGLVLLSAAAAAALLISIGLSFHMPWRPTLDTRTLFTAFLGWGLLEAFWCCRLLDALGDENARELPRAFATVLPLGCLLVLAYPASLLLFGSDEAAKTLSESLGSTHALLGWSGIVGLGMVLPAALFFLRSHRAATSVTAALLTLVSSALFLDAVLQLGSAQWHFFNQ